ncbi:MAG: SRPBCC family protein [Bacteroidetes bacterium]|nr:SRPBCC family protein [Fibrella sp.]
MEIDPNAPVITRDEIVIAAPVGTVWDLLTNVVAWPRWNKDITNARFDSPVVVGSVFHWDTAGLAGIDSTIGEVIPQRRIAWSGPSHGIMGTHVWHFTPVAEGVLVQTEESWAGEPITRQVSVMQQALDKSIRSWLESLKREAELPAVSGKAG